MKIKNYYYKEKILKNSKRFWVGLIIILSAVLFSCNKVSPDNDTLNNNYFGKEGDIKYQITLETKWDSSSHPGGPTFPSGAHFSPPVYTVHNETLSFWKRGEKATPGLESLAETGSTTKFLDEIKLNESKGVLNASSKGSLSSPGSQQFEITLDNNHPRFTLASMIAPSPDWFIGLSSFSLKDTSVKWYKNFNCDLIGYDAGTESGVTFSLGGTPTSPLEDIHPLGQDKEAIVKRLTPPFAKISFKLIEGATSSNTTDSTPTCPTH